MFVWRFDNARDFSDVKTGREDFEPQGPRVCEALKPGAQAEGFTLEGSVRGSKPASAQQAGSRGAGARGGVCACGSVRVLLNVSDHGFEISKRAVSLAVCFPTGVPSRTGAGAGRLGSPGSRCCQGRMRV